MSCTARFSDGLRSACQRAFVDGETVQAIGIIAATMVAILGMLWGVMTLVTKTVMQQGVQRTLGEIKADMSAFRTEMSALRTEFKAEISAVNARLDKQSDQIAAVRGQVS